MVNKVALITGSARRVGAIIAERLHELGYNIMIHYNNSETDANKLADKLNSIRKNSAECCYEDLSSPTQKSELIQSTIDKFSRIDVLINNASIFYKNNLLDFEINCWQDMMNINVAKPLILAQQAYHKGVSNIINILDTNIANPVKNYAIYNASKAALLSLTISMAKEWAPKVRTNAISPGAIAWPEGENELSNIEKQNILKKVSLKQVGNPIHIAKTVEFLLYNDYINGQVIKIDGGKF